MERSTENSRSSIPESLRFLVQPTGGTACSSAEKAALKAKLLGKIRNDGLHEQF
jgi:hypothetical protein